MEINKEIVDALKLKSELEVIIRLLLEEYRTKGECKYENQDVIARKYGVDIGSDLAFVLASVIYLNK